MTQPHRRLPACAPRAPERRGTPPEPCAPAAGRSAPAPPSALPNVVRHGAVLLVSLALLGSISVGGAAAAPGADGASAAVAAEAEVAAEVAAAPLQLDLDVYLVVLEERDGEPIEVRSPALEVAPGALLEWWLRARNDSGERLGSVALDLPIPAGTTYLPESAWLARLTDDGDLVAADDVAHELEFSADDAATFALEPLVRVLTREDGAAVEEIVPVEAYTHVRARLEHVPADATLVLVVRTSVR